MKNVIKVLALSLVMVMMLGLLVSCGGPSKDPDKAVEALKDNDYIAVKVGGDDEYDYEGLEAVVTGFKMESLTEGDAIVIFYFEDSASANDAWDELKEEIEEDDEDYVCKKSGKIIYAGTKQAVKDAK